MGQRTAIDTGFLADGYVCGVGEGLRHHDRSPLRWLAIPAAVALVALVLVGSRTRAVDPPAGLDIDSVLSVLEVVGYVAVMLGVIGAVFGIAVYRQRRAAPKEPGHAPKNLQPMPLWAQVLGLVVVAGVVIGQSIVILQYILELLERAARNGSELGGGGGDQGAITSTGRELATLGIAVVIVIAIGAIALALAVRWRFAGATGAADDERAEARGRAVEDSLEALLVEPDPRRAIIAAYAAMERAFARAGFARDAAEAPFEYLRRMLAGPARRAAEVRTLTNLFQLARFSHHAIDDGMRTDAIRALERIRDVPETAS